MQRRVQGATPARRLRELTDVLEALTVARPLVLVLEDLHWSDAATVELLAALARRWQFLQGSGLAEWPDGTVASCYQFRHALYQQVIYDRVPVGR